MIKKRWIKFKLCNLYEIPKIPTFQADYEITLFLRFVNLTEFLKYQDLSQTLNYVNHVIYQIIFQNHAKRI